MGESARMGLRGRLVAAVGAVLLAGGLLALSLPVSLDDYDRFGIQVTCGNGYHSHLIQETVDDQGDQCGTAVARRRAWAIPATGIGALILIPTMTTWLRKKAAEPGFLRSDGAWSASAHPDQGMHEAAVLDRRDRSHGMHSSNTTL